MDGDQVMPARGALEGAFEIPVEKITEQKDDRAPPQDAVDEIERVTQGSAQLFRLEEQDVADKAQNVARAFSRRHEALDAVRKRHQADLVIIINGAEGQNGSQFRNDFFLLLDKCAELLAAAAVDGEQDRQLALFDVALDERVPHAGRDVPIDGPNIIAGLVFTDLLKGDAHALEDTMIFAADQILHGPARPDLQTADLP